MPRCSRELGAARDGGARSMSTRSRGRRSTTRGGCSRGQPDRLGTTLPGRWPRSVDDARRATETGLRVRVVKGQWPDATAPDVDPAEGVLRVVDRLAGLPPRRVAVATHDVSLLGEALSRLTAAGVPCAVELFLGLPFAGPLRLARDLGVPVRVYVAYGTGGAPYSTAELTRNPAAVVVAAPGRAPRKGEDVAEHRPRTPVPVTSPAPPRDSIRGTTRSSSSGGGWRASAPASWGKRSSGVATRSSRACRTPTGAGSG